MCPIGQYTEGYVPAAMRDGETLYVGSHNGEAEIRNGRPACGPSSTWLRSVTKAANIDIGPRSRVSLTNVIGCKPAGGEFPTSRSSSIPRDVARAGVQHCIEHHLLPTLKRRRWQRVVALGEAPLQALTGRAGISTWRGSPLQGTWLPADAAPVVMPTLDYAELPAKQKWFDTMRRDLGKALVVPQENIRLYATADDLRGLAPQRIVVDFEWYDIMAGRTTDFVTLAGIAVSETDAYVVGANDAAAMAELRHIVEGASVVAAHNMVGAEAPWFVKLGWNVPAATRHDTMLMQALLQPDMPHSLAYCASFWSTAVHWKGRGEEREDDASGAVRGGEQWRTWDRTDAIPRQYGGYGGCVSADEAFRLYNGRDCLTNFRILAPLESALRTLRQPTMTEPIAA